MMHLATQSGHKVRDIANGATTIQQVNLNKEINIVKTQLVMLRVPSAAKDISTKIGHKHKELPYFKTV